MSKLIVVFNYRHISRPLCLDGEIISHKGDVLFVYAEDGRIQLSTLILLVDLWHISVFN